ncbi:hypothetical protein FB451DRAFT_1397623 [Mycena latifolia]|nr:hypothetical protein FB451DRAFT_1397623 [Mycena latifolia]
MASAVPTNHTIDDAAVLADCVNCVRPDRNAFDVAQLHNGTVTEVTGGTSGIRLEFNGTAIYVFFLVPAVNDNPFPGLTPTPQSSQSNFFMEGVFVSSLNATLPALSEYNFLAYANSSLQDGAHVLDMAPAAGSGFYFDYAIYTSDDPNTPSSSSGVQSTAATSTPVTSTAPSSATTDSSNPPPSTSSALPSKKKTNAGAIAGGVVGGVAVILAFVAGLIFCRRSRRNKGNYASDKEELPGQSFGYSMVSNGNPVAISSEAEGPPASDTNADAVAAQLRRLTDQVEQLARRGEGSSVTESDIGSPASLGRSLSTMKRDQTLAVRNSQPVDAVRDSFVHTDSGLRLAVGRVEIDEVPPLYEAE